MLETALSSKMLNRLREEFENGTSARDAVEILKSMMEEREDNAAQNSACKQPLGEPKT